MTVVIHVREGKREVDRVERTRWEEVDRAAGEASAPVAVVDVESPPLEGRDDVHVTIVIEVSHDDGATRDGPPRSWSGQCGMELPVAFPISEVDLDACLRVADENQVELAVAVDIGEVRCHIPILAAHDRLREPSLPIADEGLDAAEVAGADDVREAVVV